MIGIKKSFGKRVFSLRKQLGISQERLGVMAKIHRTYISEIERGEANISLEHIEKLSIALNISLCDLFKFNDICS